MNRREFLRGAGLLGGSALVAACAQPASETVPPPAHTATTAPTVMATATRVPPPTGEPTVTSSPPAPTATATAARRAATVAPSVTPATVSAADWLGKVVLIKTADRADGVRRALARWDGAALSGKRVLVKPNFNSADPTPGSTHADVLRALVEGLKERGASDITVGDRSGMGDTRRVMEALGVFRLADELGFAPVVFDELPADGWVTIKQDGDHWARGFAVPKLLVEADAVVQTCNLKTHRFGGHFTLSLKNSVGFAAKQVPGQGYNYMTELHGSSDQRRMIAEINRTYHPALVVMDGVEGFADGGPDRGRIIEPGVILAGADRIALDAVGVAILRLFGTTDQVSRGRVFEQEQIARAVELQLGVSGPGDVQIITEDEAGETFAAQLRPLLI